MADNEPVAEARTPPPGGGRGRVCMRGKTILLVGGVAAGAAVLYFWWRNRQASSAAASSSSGTGCTDSSGNPVPCPDASTGVDDAGALSAVQTELESLLSEEGTEGTGAATTTGTTTTPPGSGSTPTPPAGSFPGTGTTTATATIPATPTGLSSGGVTASGFRVGWKASTGAASYQWRVTYQSKLVKSGTVTGTSATVSGLTANHTYTFHVKACNAKGCSAETNGPAVKTSR